MISQVLKFERQINCKDFTLLKSVRQKNLHKIYFFMIYNMYMSYGVNRQRKTLRSNLFVLIIF